MKTFLPVIALLAAVSVTHAKPPAGGQKEPPKKPFPTPAPAVESSVDNALARWLALAPSGKDAFVLPFAPLVSAASGKQISAFDPAIPADAAALAKIGGALDALLPRMNQPDSSARTASASGGDAVVAAFEGELCALLAANPSAADAKTQDRFYPRFSYADATASKSYYLSVSVFPTGGDPVTEALGLRPDLAARRITADGCCLLIAVEHNGKPGKDLAFLNWQIVDLAKVKWRYVPFFVTGGADAHPSSAVLTDGRKGRD